jgi:hypothetical protein
VYLTVDFEGKSFGSWMMHFLDDLMDNSLSNSPFISLELCFIGSELEFAEKSKRLLQTYFSRKQEKLFWFVWNEFLGFEEIEEMVKGIYNNFVLIIYK